MKRIDLSFFKNKFYISGFLSGLFVAVFAAIIITAVYTPEPDTSKVKGTMASKECARVKAAKDKAAKPDCSDCH